MFARPLLFVVFSEDGVRWGFLLAGLLLSQVVVIVAVVVISVFDEDGMCMSCWAWDWSNWDGSKVVGGHREGCSCAVRLLHANNVKHFGRQSEPLGAI